MLSPHNKPTDSGLRNAQFSGNIRFGHSYFTDSPVTQQASRLYNGWFLAVFQDIIHIHLHQLGNPVAKIRNYPQEEGSGYVMA